MNACTIFCFLTVLQHKCVHPWMHHEFAWRLSRVLCGNSTEMRSSMHEWWMNHEWTRDERKRVHDFPFHYGNTTEMRSSMNEWWMNHEWTRDERKRVHDFPFLTVLQQTAFIDDSLNDECICNERAINVHAFSAPYSITTDIHSFINEWWCITNERAMNATAFTICRFVLVL